MKNTKDIIKSLDNHKMFVNIDSKLLKKLKSQKILKGFRNDGAGSRLMCYVNLVRLSKKFKKNFIFYWDLRNDKYSDAWPHNKIASKKVDIDKLNLKNIKYYNSSKNNISKPNLTEWKFIVLKGEKKLQVLKECRKIMLEIFSTKNAQINIKNNFAYGLHIRCGGLNATTGRLTHITSIHFYKDDFNLGKWYPYYIWTDVLKKIKTNKSILVSDDYDYIKKQFNLNNNIKLNKIIRAKNLDELDIFIKDVISVSNSKSVICSVKSGAGLIIMLLSKGNFYTPEKFLNIENIYFSFSDILYKYYLKHNTLKNLLKHNKDYFLSRPIQKFNNLRNKFKKSL